MKVTQNNDGSFLVKLSEEEWKDLKEIQELFEDCSEKFDGKVGLEEILKEVFKAGFCWLS